MTDIAPSAGQHRLEALDGVRGIAALSVVVF
jgi:peptidoglycan/LPS O-acetylase OafA/YrhL